MSPGARLAVLRERQTWVWLHRWVGLVMTLFLVIAGLTGSLLAFYDELDTLLSPRTYLAAPSHDGAAMLDMVTLRERALAEKPGMWTDSVGAVATQPFTVAMGRVARCERRGGRQNCSSIRIPERSGSRRWGTFHRPDQPDALRLRLHTSALGTVGTCFRRHRIAVDADCFVGAYLTLPRGRPSRNGDRPGASSASASTMTCTGPAVCGPGQCSSWPGPCGVQSAAGYYPVTGALACRTRRRRSMNRQSRTRLTRPMPWARN